MGHASRAGLSRYDDTTESPPESGATPEPPPPQQPLSAPVGLLRHRMPQEAVRSCSATFRVRHIAAVHSVTQPIFPSGQALVRWLVAYWGFTILEVLEVLQILEILADLQPLK